MSGHLIFVLLVCCVALPGVVLLTDEYRKDTKLGGFLIVLSFFMLFALPALITVVSSPDERELAAFVVVLTAAAIGRAFGIRRGREAAAEKLVSRELVDVKHREFQSKLHEQELVIAELKKKLAKRERTIQRQGKRLWEVQRPSSPESGS